ncbi:CPK4 [Symbiodinium natans]|uniref:non-specific serine/threonine protein kinase n=1 Tax=Symbiodinium natans TaxID=878477 RepID=A0A812SZK0_9DINO|nr:CPK4 [Symbiodinium natans]
MLQYAAAPPQFQARQPYPAGSLTAMPFAHGASGCMLGSQTLFPQGHMQPQQQPMIQPHFQAQQAWQQQLQQSQQRQAMPRLAQLPQASQQQQPQPFPQAWQPPQQQQQAWQPQQQQQQQPPQLHANGCQGQHPNRHHQDEYYARPGQTPIRLPALDPDPDPAYLHDFAMKAAMMDAAMMTGFGTAGSSPSCSPLGSPSQYDYEDTAMDERQLYLAIQNPRLTEHLAASLFRRMDKSGTGRLSYHELLRFLPILYQELGLSLVKDTATHQKLVHNRMRKFDRNGDGSLDQREFLQLYRWTLHRKYEDLKPPKFGRSALLRGAKPGVPAQFYDFGDMLGSGSFGIVHSVTQKATGVKRVMKTVNKMKLQESNTPLACLDQEIQLLAMLDHPRILRLYEWYSDSENVYIITDVCEGGELFDLVRASHDQQQSIPEAWIRRIFTQATEAISYCHGKGVMHKDLKFENLLLQKSLTHRSRLEDVNIVIIDVGLAELFGPSHGKGMRSSARSGSLATIAPEVLQGDFCYKCDVWSLGCMLYAVFNSQPTYMPGPDGNDTLYPYPFCPQPSQRDRLGVEGLMQQQRAGPNMRRLNASPAVKDLVGRMLCFEEEARPAAKECLRSPWLAWGGSTPLECQAQSKQESLKIMMSTIVDHDREHRTWWRAVTVQAAAQLPGGVLEPLAQLFRQAHEGHTDGAIEKGALVLMLERLKVNPELAQSAADGADFDGDGLIEFSEFVATCLPSARELFAVSLQMAFHSFDTNSDGTLDRAEVAQLLQSGQIEETHLPKTKTVQEMVEELDLDHNGVISFSEFQHYFMNVDAGL